MTGNKFTRMSQQCHDTVLTAPFCRKDPFMQAVGSKKFDHCKYLKNCQLAKTTMNCLLGCTTLMKLVALHLHESAHYFCKIYVIFHEDHALTSRKHGYSDEGRHGGAGHGYTWETAAHVSDTSTSVLSRT